MVPLHNTKKWKNFLNLCHHKDDFGLAAEWHFSATSHGKGACDGLGGTIKWAVRASLQRPYNDQLMMPRQLSDWASVNVPAAHFGYCSNEDYKSEQRILDQRFHQSRIISGTIESCTCCTCLKQHCGSQILLSFRCFQERESHAGRGRSPTWNNRWLCHHFAWWKLVVSMCARSHSGSEANISPPSWSLKLVQIPTFLRYPHCTNRKHFNPSRSKNENWSFIHINEKRYYLCI